MKIFLLIFSFSLCFSIDIIKPSIYDETKHNIQDWLMSEKLDGIRAIWNGKELQTKNGNKIYAPAWFTVNFPNFELDGELWTKYEDFENIQSIVLSQNKSENWENITYNIFEVPKQNGNFLERLKVLENFLSKNPNKFIKIIPQIKIKDKKHLNIFLDEILRKNGEGVIVKNPNLSYEAGRSQNILKVKAFFDEEGEVISHNFNKDGSFRSLNLKLKDGTIFKLGGGFSLKDRKKPPKIGSTVTFKYYGFTKNNKPKFASFLRVRKDE
ncbi:DNA ligase [Arcobacter vandammei]|uniref:DNA ligase n=1 Tax=Arcobacter vandammei TaxID=2782243 RepID=UPI0018DF0C98|nr:DNA ligase [Arcobacter vandammei]